MESKNKKKHGQYILETKDKILIYNTRLKKGRVILDSGKAVDINPPNKKVILAILKNGERVVNPFSEDVKLLMQKKDLK